jgi:hypothetical protein
MGNRERVILTSKAERIAERAFEMAWAPRPGLPTPIPYPALGGVPAKAPVRRTRSSPCCRVLPEHPSGVDRNGKFAQVSESFCKLLG